MNAFVRPDSVVLALAGGATIIVKRRLNTGEQHALAAAMMRTPTTPDEKPRVDPLKVGLETTLAYLLDWTLTDDGRPVPIREQAPEAVRAALKALEYDVYQEIRGAIDAHVLRQDLARAEEKKSQDIGSPSSASSPSPSDVVGAMNG